MYSKPKGIYVKQRDRPVQRISPRKTQDLRLSLPTDNESQMSQEVQVDSFGDGHNEAYIVEQWPKQNFEKGDEESEVEHKLKHSINEPQPSTSTAQNGFSERAQKYIVKNDSYKDLKRAKYITVPEPKINRTDAYTAKRSMQGSVRSFGQVHDNDDFPFSSTPRYLPLTFPHAGTNFGIPSSASTKHSHFATIRVHPKQHKVKGHMYTLKPIPHDSAIHTVKGYHLQHNATVRAHNTGHAVKSLKHAISSWDRPDGTFRRNTYMTDRKEYYVNQFSIELDRPETDIYTAGDTLSGRLILEVLSNLEIRFVELLIVGVASVQFSKHDPTTTKSGEEVLVSKRSYVMGTPDGRWNSVITAGKYVSKFKFKLPAHLPSTVKYENKEKGFNFEVGYLVKARICDEMGSSSLRSVHSTNTYVKVLLTRRFPFMVRQPFDLQSIPKALQPVNRSEIVNVNCLPICIDAASITLSMERSVFLAGEDVRVKLVTSASTARKIKSLTCELHQHVFSKIRPRQNYILVQVYNHDPEGLVFKQQSETLALFEFIIPTQTNFVPSYLLGINLVKVRYTIMMTIKFKSCSGQLFLECPIGIGPCADQMTSETNAVPVFNRPKRFPYFSRESQGVAKTQNGTVHSAPQGNQVNMVNKAQDSSTCIII